MIYIRVAEEWYSTKYIAYGELTEYEYKLSEAIYDDKYDVIKRTYHDYDIWHIQPVYTFEQVKLELFLQKGRFHEWSTAVHKYRN